MVNLDEPICLAVGTEVSAKYKGAFCEAKIKKILKSFKCKVLYSDAVTAFVSDEVIKGPLKVGAAVEVKSSDKKEFVSATIQKIQDCSLYTVVFDDGDITCLKRTALCLKSGKYYASEATLDENPLTHPEHIVTPLPGTIIPGRRSRNHKKSVGENEECVKMKEKYIGKVICVEANDKKKVKDNWYPGLIVAATAHSSAKINIAEDNLVRSFKDGKYYTVPKKEMNEFTIEIGARVENPTLKTAVEKAILYLVKNELPTHWDRRVLFGTDKITVKDSEGVCNENSDEEPIEQKDHFVAQLFKFMDDRGTPLNQAPMINDKDVDMYKLFKTVYNFGGFNKVTKCKQWKLVAQKIDHEQSINCVKTYYQQHLLSFEDFYRKLGCTMVSLSKNSNNKKYFRNLIRDVNKAQPSTSSSTTEKNKQSSTSVKEESNEKKDKVETVLKENETVKDTVTVKKTVKPTKTEEKILQKNNEESSKKCDKKMDDNGANIVSPNKSGVKCDSNILKTKDSKTKKELKSTIKKEEDKTENIEVKQDDGNTELKKVEKKKYTRNLFGKSSMPKTIPKKEKVAKVKPTETVLSSARKKRSIKEQLKNFIKIMTPFKKSKRIVSNTQLETNKIKLDEDASKLTRSKSKEDGPRKKKFSLLSEQIVAIAVVQPFQSPKTVEHQSTAKNQFQDGSEKKKTKRKKKDDKDDKMVLNDVIPVNGEVVITDKSTFVNMGDNIIVYYGDQQATTYEAKVIKAHSDVIGGQRLYVHYKGWNSRYDEWINTTRITVKAKYLEPEPELDAETDSSKSEQNSIDTKKLPPTSSRTRRSTTPGLSSQSKKSLINSVRPTRTCTMSDRSLSIIDYSDSESEYTGNIKLSKQCNKKTQQASKTTKSEPDIIKSEPLDTDNQKKTLYPKTYPSKEVLMQRNVPKKPKSSVIKVHSNKSEENEISKQDPLTPSFDFSYEIPSSGEKKNLDSENVLTQNVGDSVQSELKISPIHYLSPKEKFEKNNPPQVITEFSKNCIENVELTDFSTKSKKTGVIFYESSEDEEQCLTKITSTKCDEISLPLDDKSNEYKILGTDFDLNEIRSEMKGLMPTSTISNLDLSLGIASKSESLPLDQQVANVDSKNIELITEDIYEFKDSEPCDFETIPSSVEEKHRRVIKNIDPPKLYGFEKPIELPRIIESDSQVDVIEQNESIVPFKSNINDVYTLNVSSSGTAVHEVDCKENIVHTNYAEDSISQDQSDNESNESQNLVIHDVIIDTEQINENEENDFNETCHNEVSESSEIKDEVLDLCMKPPQSPPNNIFNMSKPNEVGDMVEEDVDDENEDEDEDDDESKLVIAENDKIENDYQVDTNLIISEENESSYAQTDNIQIKFPSPLTSNIQQLSYTKSEFKISYGTKNNLKNTDNGSPITSCSDSIQNALIQSFPMYSHYENESTNTNAYQTFINDDNSTKPGFEFESNSKSPTTSTKENVESSIKLSINESIKSDSSKEYGLESGKIRYKSEKEITIILPELQCREEIVDEESSNNALAIEYSQKSAEYDIHKPGTSKSFFDSIHKPSSSKNTFYEADTSSDAKNIFFEDNQASLVKNVILDTNTPCTSRSNIFDDNIHSSNSKDSLSDTNKACTSKISVYDNPVPSTSRSFYNSEQRDVNNVLFCEETIPGSPTGLSEEQFDQEEKKRALVQALFEEREAASAMYLMNRAFRRSAQNLIGSTEKAMEEYSTNTFQNDNVDHSHLQFLAEVSSRNMNIIIDEPLVTKPQELDQEPIIEKITKPPEKPLSKRKTSNHEHSTTKRHKAAALAPITESNIQKPVEIKMTIPLKDGKPIVVFTPDMDSTQRQAVIIAKMNELRNDYLVVKGHLSVVDKRRKKIRKRKRDMAKLATKNQNKPPTATSVK